MPKSKLCGKRAVLVAVVATLVGVSTTVVSGQSTAARAASAPGSTVRASVGNGTPPAQSARGGANQELSADGTTVVFTSADQLDTLPNDGNESVYVRDLRSGKTVMISRGQFTLVEIPDIGRPRLAGKPLLSLNGQPPLALGETAPTGSSRTPTISGDGRYVAFVTRADNIVTDDLDQDQDVLVCDRDPDGDGTFDEPREEGEGLDYRYFRVNQPQVQQGEGGSYRVDFPTSPKISDDASRIVWEDTLVQPSGQYDDVVRTALVAPPAVGTLAAVPGPGQVVDTMLDGLRPTSQYWPDVSADGRFVVLVGTYERPEGGGEFPYYVPFQAVVRKDMNSGTVLRVDWDESTTPDDVTYLSSDESVGLAAPAMSADGTEIAFVAEEFEDTCSEGCWNSVAQQPVVYVVRIDADNRPVDSAVASRDNENEIVNGFGPALSGDGRFLAFGTDNAGVHDGVDVPLGDDDDSCVTYRGDLRSKPLINLSGLPPTSEARGDRVVCQVVVRDLVVDRERVRNELPRIPGTLVSAGTGTDCAPEGGTCAGDQDSPPDTQSPPSLSHNGSTVAFDSVARNLVPADTNDRTDVFVRTFRPELRADPSPLDFGLVGLEDSVDQVVRFDHVGTGPLVVTEIAVDGSDDFAVGAQTCGGAAVVLQQAGSCEVSVTFSPNAPTNRTGTLRLTTRDGRDFTVPLRGRATTETVRPERARFAAGPNPANFGDRLLLSDGPTQTVTVTNGGGAPLTIGSITVVSALAPTDYTITADTCSGKPVAPRTTCQVTVTFKPTAPGDRPAVLRFVDTAPGGQVHLTALTGKGSTPVIQVSPGVTPPGRAVTVTGAGFPPNHPVTITIAGSVELARATTDVAGGFTSNLLILPKSPIGTRPVTATIDGTTLAAQRPLLIVTPSVSPSDFVGRG